jgi:uncharacterized membrane protein
MAITPSEKIHERPRDVKQTIQGKGLAHPIHPALVHLPIGFWFASLIFDVLSKAQDNPVSGNLWVNAAWYLILFGVIAAVPAAISGLAEFVDLPQSTRVQRIALTHMILNVLIIVGYIVHLFIRDTSAVAVSNATLFFNIGLIGLLSYSGYLGGKLAYLYAVGTRTRENPQRSIKGEDINRAA